MLKTTHLKNNKGFSLLEASVVMIVAALIVSTLAPSAILNVVNQAAQKTTLDVNNIESASLAYYAKNNSWPTSIAPANGLITDLETSGFLPSGWNASNPFGKQYTISTTASLLTVSTQVQSGTQTTIISQLPTSSFSGNVISSSVPIPGSSSVVPSGTILSWPGTTAPSGFLLCDGSVYSISSYPNVAAIVGSTFGGNGTTTFAVPDLRGRIVVGLNGLTTKDGSNRIWSIDNFSNNQGNAQSYNVNIIGAISGEEKHRQTVVEMAPHTHSFASWDYVKGFSGNSTTSPRDPQGGTTGSAGGNGDGTGLGAAANIVPPSMTLTYIIKS